MAIQKARYWGFIVYPESMDPDWLQKLLLTGLPIAISPLHDKDCYDDTGELEKPHYHVLMCFDGPTTRKNVDQISSSVGGTHCTHISSVRGTYEYHIHKNNPEKYQYNNADRKLLNGFDIQNYSYLNNNDEIVIIKCVKEYIDRYEIKTYWKLVDYLEKNDLEAFNYVVHHTLLFNTLVKSRWGRQD